MVESQTTAEVHWEFEEVRMLKKAGEEKLQ